MTQYLPTGPQVIVVMGVSGSGKTTVGRALAFRLGWPFAEGDLLHTPDNIAKMAAGQALTDTDRDPWLDRVAAWIDESLAGEHGGGRHGVISCSALKRRYRDRLRRAQVVFVELAVPPDELRARLHHREGHFMPASLLESQLADLQPPAADERAVTVPATDSAAQTVDRVIDALRALTPPS